MALVSLIPSLSLLRRMLGTSWPGLLAILFLLVLGLIMPAGIMATIRNVLLYINLVVPWVILFSLGYPSFATAAFFGVGSYITTYSLLNGLSPAVGIALSALFSLAIALAIGYITLRLV